MTSERDPATSHGNGEHGERHEDKRIVPPEARIPEAQLSETAQMEPARQAPLLQPSRSARYSERLKLIWAAAHPQTEADDQEWRAFYKAMLRVGDVVALVGDEAELTSETGETLDGDVNTIELRVAGKVASEPDAVALATYVRNTLAPTMARLEQAGEGTPERRVDVVVRLLAALRGTPTVGDLACELFRYLQNQDPDERQAGFYMTVANLATTVSTVGGDFRRAEGAVMCHVVLDGMRGLAARNNLLEGTNTSPVSNMAFNVAVDVLTLLRRRGEEFSEQGVQVLRDLKFISASTAGLVDLDVEKVDPGEVVSALGFETNDARAFLTVLVNMGGMAEAWQETPIGLARLEASSGVADAVRVAPERCAMRLFNAGISLIRAQSDDRTQLIEGRLLLNTLGLRLALHQDRDLYAALVELGGLDCAVNLVGAFVEHQRIADPDAINGLKPLVRQLVDLPKWPPLREKSSGVDVDLARLTGAGERLGMTPQERTSFPELLSSLDSALDALRAATGASRALAEPLLDTAQLVSHIFTAVLPPTVDSADLQQTIDEIVTSRDEPVDTLITRYARYASWPDDPIGAGPLVVAGVLERSEWDRVARRLLNPLPSIVLALRDFSLP